MWDKRNPSMPLVRRLINTAGGNLKDSKVDGEAIGINEKIEEYSGMGSIFF